MKDGLYDWKSIDTSGNLSILFKMYWNELEKFNEVITNNFDRKFTMFLERYDQFDTSIGNRLRSFLILLTNTAC